MTLINRALGRNDLPFALDRPVTGLDIEQLIPTLLQPMWTSAAASELAVGPAITAANLAAANAATAATSAAAASTAAATSATSAAAANATAQLLKPVTGTVTAFTLVAPLTVTITLPSGSVVAKRVKTYTPVVSDTCLVLTDGTVYYALGALA